MRNRILFAVLAAIVGLGCVRLGFWQLDRREQRLARNAEVAARAERPVVDVERLGGDTSALRFRRARIAGVADYAHDLVLGSRARNGSPGVNLLTPVRIPGSDTAVLVNRGWVYSPDAATLDPEPWRERDTVVLQGYVEILGPGDAAPPNPARPRALPRATLAAVRARVPYPVAPVYVVAQTPPDSMHDSVPVRVALPSVTDEGSHLSYAVQWFLFATVAFAGAGIALTKR